MGYDKLISFFCKNLQNNCFDDLFLFNDEDNIITGTKEVITNHVFFDVNFIIYLCIGTLEDEINQIIKYILSLSFTDNSIIENKIKEILNLPHWKKINTENIFDGNDVDEIISNLNNLLEQETEGILNKNILLYWTIFFKIESLINNFHDIKYIKSINIFFDGIPSYSKILEQRRRRFTNYIESQIRKKKYNSYFKDVIETPVNENDVVYDYFEWYNKKFNFEKSLGPFSSTILKLVIFLKETLKTLYSNINIHIDSSKNYGEADYKIFKYILDNNLKNDICIHSCDSDFLYLSLLFQSLSDTKLIDLNLNFLRYSKKNEEIYELFDASNINNLLLEKYKFINQLDTNITNTILFDFFFIILLFGNDILPNSFEINSELNLKIIFEIHYNLYKNEKNIIDINNKNIINFNNLKLFLVYLNKKKLLTITILNKYFKIPYNIIIIFTEKLNYNLQQIIEKILIPYYEYQGHINIDNLDKDDIRYIYYLKNKKTTNNPINQLNLDNCYKNQIKDFLESSIDFTNLNDFGLIKLEKSIFIDEINYQNLYNLILINKSSFNLIDEYQEEKLLEKLNQIDNNIFDINIVSDQEDNIYEYLKLLNFQSFILFNNLENYYPNSLIYYKKNTAPSISKIISFLNNHNMDLLQKEWIDEVENKKNKDYIFTPISHYLLITPYLLNSEYLKKINNIPNLENILNVINYSIKGIWYKEGEDFKLKNIDPIKYLDICNRIMLFYNTVFAKKIIQSQNKLINF